MTIYSHMTCPFCKNSTNIFNSRSTQNRTQTWRRHNCEATFTTKERIDWTGRVQVLTAKDRAPYSRDRLLLSIAKASDNLDLPVGAVTDLTDTIELELQNTGFFSSKSPNSEFIIQTSTLILHRYDANLALQYINNVYRNKPPRDLLKRVLNA